MTFLGMAAACGAFGYLLLLLGTLGVLFAFATLVTLLVAPHARPALAAGGACIAIVLLIALVTRGAARWQEADQSPCVPIGIMGGALPLAAGVAALVTGGLRRRRKRRD